MPKGEFVLEVRCEEIPARMLQPATAELEGAVVEALGKLGLAPKLSESSFTPRRLFLGLKGLPESEPDRVVQEVGPPTRIAFDSEGKPTKAAEGFAKRCGVEAGQLQRLETEKGEYLAADVKHEGRSMSAVLAEVVPEILHRISWAKTMRWGNGTGPWVRPVHGVVAILGEEVVPFRFFDSESGQQTVGHPILSPRSFKVNGVADYKRKLLRRGIQIDFESRRGSLVEGMEQAARESGGEVVDDADLLDKLASICEVPGVVHGSFDAKYLDLPREVLIASLRDHQSALTVESKGSLQPVFLTLMDRPDDPEGLVRAGNEWVVEARLADAEFFFNEDRKRSLEEFADSLGTLTFHVKLGSYADKTARIRQLSQFVCDELGWKKERGDAERAAHLLKADLPTEMVKEFTSLQGVVGGIYAQADKERAEVAHAIADQYLPSSASDPIPRGRAGMACGIADRIDTLVGIFGLGLKPSGSRDPFGLRRAAQAVVKMALDAGLSLDLDMLAARAVLLYGDRLELSGDETLSALRPFFQDRLRHVLGREGYSYDEIEAALAVGFSDLPDLRARVEALHAVRDDEDFVAVVLAAKRIANILKDAPEHAFSQRLLKEPAERELANASRDLKAEVQGAQEKRAYGEGLQSIASFAPVLERFFTEVLVMDENRELRQNRIALLQGIQRTLSRIARLTEMVVDRSDKRKG